MILPLVKKELKQHFISFVILYSLSILALLIMLLVIIADKNKTDFLKTLAAYVIFITPCIAVVICHKLVYAEYSNRTQFFLESLPVSRLDFFLVKCFLGFIFIFIMIGISFSLFILYGFLINHINGSFAFILGSRILFFVVFIYSFFFLMGYTGRYRFAVYMLLFLLYIFLTNSTNFDFSRFSPFALLNNTFAYERFELPLNDIINTIIISSVFIIISLLLALIREGSLASLISNKMSHKEKIIIGMITLFIIISITTFDAKKERPPFDIINAKQSIGDGITIKVAGDLDHSNKYQSIADYLHEELVSMRKYLGIEKLKPVFIVQNESFLPMIYEKAELKKTDGILIFSNLNHDKWDLYHLELFVIKEILNEYTKYQVSKEENIWLLDGFAEFWTNRNLNNRDFLQMRAAYGMDSILTYCTIKKWYIYQIKKGEDISGAVGWTGIDFLIRNYSKEKTQKFLQQVLGKKHSANISVIFSSINSNCKKAFEIIFKEKYKDFIKEWSADIETLKIKFKNEIKKIPKIKTSVTINNVSKNSRSVRINVDLVQEKNEGSQILYCFYKQLNELEEYSSVPAMKIKTFNYNDNSYFDLPEYYISGDLINYFILTYVKSLNCYISSPWERRLIN